MIVSNHALNSCCGRALVLPRKSPCFASEEPLFVRVHGDKLVYLIKFMIKRVQGLPSAASLGSFCDQNQQNTIKTALRIKEIESQISDPIPIGFIDPLSIF